jgi:DinB superfamily
VTEVDVDQEAALKQKARDYMRTRGTLAAVSAVREQIAAALGTLETVLDGVTAEQAARASIPGEWTVQEIVDHLVETFRPGVDELRCLLADQAPPGDPIPATLRSKAPRLRPWPWLLAELRRLNADALGVLAEIAPGFETGARAPIVMVINVPAGDRGIQPAHWIEELDWKAYSMVSWRLHTLDHIAQIRKVLRA